MINTYRIGDYDHETSTLTPFKDLFKDLSEMARSGDTAALNTLWRGIQGNTIDVDEASYYDIKKDYNEFTDRDRNFMIPQEFR